MGNCPAGLNVVQIYGMECRTTIGVLEWEKKQPQTVVLDLDIGIPYTEEAFVQDRLEGTIDYMAIAEDLRGWLLAYRCELLEYLAERIAERLFERYPAISLRIAVTKPGILPNASRVTVCIERNRG
jgi:7,8-dihydroneopterin aldolase/epimerase/oxygenase